MPGAKRVVAEAIDGDVFVEPKQTGLPVETAEFVRFDADFLAELTVLRQAIGRFRREQRFAKIVGRERVHRAAVDIAAAEGFDVFVTGDRIQRVRAEIPAHAQIRAELFERLLVDAVDRDAVAVEIAAQFVGARLDDAGAEQTRGAVELARMHVRQRFEGIAGLEQELHAAGAFFVTLEILARAVGDVIDVIVAALMQAGHAHRRGLVDRASQGTVDVEAVALGQADAHVAAELILRPSGFEFDHAGRRIAAEERALRTARHFDLIQIEQREAFENRVFLHHAVVHQRHRLRGVEIEVGVAETADIETRERTAERGFDIQAGQTAGQQADVFATGGNGIELFAIHCRDRHRYVLDVFHAALRGDGDGIQRPSIVLLGRCVLSSGHRRQREQNRGGQAAETQAATSGNGRVIHERVLWEWDGAPEASGRAAL